MNRKFATALLMAIAAASAAGCSSGRTKNNLFLAVGSGDLVEIKSIVDENPSIKDAYLNDGWTALTVAARDGNIQAVNLLIEEGADINRLEGGGNSPLFWAVYYGHEDVVATLLRHGARVHNKCANCRDPMDVAKEKDYKAISKMLSDRET